MRVDVRNLYKSYGQTRAVNDVSFSFETGQVYGFVGPNGAGKTTTMKIMATLEEPDSGDVLIDGVSVLEDPDLVRGVVGYMPDNLPEHRDMSVHEYLDFFARVHNLKGDVRRQTLEDIEVFTNLLHFRERPINGLSKGMKQRVSLARALIHDPKVLIMDEPAAGLDPKARIELRELIRTLSEQGKAILISSHILGELSEMCHGHIIIESGELLHAGELEQITQETQPLRKVWIKPLKEPKMLYTHLLEMPGLEEAALVGDEVSVTLPADDVFCANLLSGLIKKDIAILEFRQHKADLEEIFMQVTNRERK